MPEMASPSATSSSASSVPRPAPCTRTGSQIHDCGSVLMQAMRVSLFQGQRPSRHRLHSAHWQITSSTNQGSELPHAAAKVLPSHQASTNPALPAPYTSNPSRVNTQHLTGKQPSLDIMADGSAPSHTVISTETHHPLLFLRQPLLHSQLQVGEPVALLRPRRKDHAVQHLH